MGKLIRFLWNSVKLAAMLLVAGFVVFAFAAKDGGETFRKCKELGMPVRLCEHAAQYSRFLSPKVQTE